MATLPILPPFQSPFGKVTATGGTDTLNTVTGINPATNMYTTHSYTTVDPTKLILMGRNAQASLIALGFPDPNGI